MYSNDAIIKLYFSLLNLHLHFQYQIGILLFLWICGQWWRVGKHYFALKLEILYALSIGIVKGEFDQFLRSPLCAVWLRISCIFWRKHYYCHQTGSTIYVFDWHIYSWPWLLLKVEVQSHVQFDCKYIINDHKQAQATAWNRWRWHFIINF